MKIPGASCRTNGSDPQAGERMEYWWKGVNGSYLLSDLKGQMASDEVNTITAYNALQTAILQLSQLMNIRIIKIYS